MNEGTGPQTQTRLDAVVTCTVGHEPHDQRLDRLVHRLVLLRVARVSAVDVLLGQGGSGGASGVRVDVVPSVQLLRRVRVGRCSRVAVAMELKSVCQKMYIGEEKRGEASMGSVPSSPHPKRHIVSSACVHHKPVVHHPVHLVAAVHAAQHCRKEGGES